MSLGHKCVLQAIGYQEIKERFTFEQRVASYGLVKLTTWRWQGLFLFKSRWKCTKCDFFLRLPPTCKETVSFPLYEFEYVAQ